MGAKQNVIEINGKKYDAATGKIVNPAARTSAPTGSIDGVARRSKPIQPNIVASVRKVKSTSSRTQTAHTKKTTQKSKALMRSAVKKPTPTPKKQPAQARKELGSSQARITSAHHAKKHPNVHRYEKQSTATSSVIKKTAHLPVKKAPAHAPAPDKHAANSVRMAPRTKPHMTAAAKMIEESLANATAHENPRAKAPKKKRRLAQRFGISPRAVAISSTILAGVLLGGFITIQNVPNLSMRVAAARAGFNAKMPNYSPSGFSFSGPINYSNGRVTVSFTSNVDDRQYDVTQRASNWNSDALLANFILEEGKQYQTYVERGRTLYIYDGSNATWVDNGVWYSVEGQSAMTTDQLNRIASSI